MKPPRLDIFDEIFTLEYKKQKYGVKIHALIYKKFQKVKNLLLIQKLNKQSRLIKEHIYGIIYLIH